MPRFCPLPNPNEEWRPYPEFPEYEVSTFGRVRRNGRALTFGLVNGYATVGLSFEGKHVSRLVNRMFAWTFLGPPPTPEHEAAHWDGVRLNNTEGNIRWATKRSNMDDRRRHGMDPIGEKHPNVKTTQATVVEARRLYRRHMEVRNAKGYVRAERGFRDDLMAATGLSLAIVKDIISERSWAPPKQLSLL